MWLMFFNGADKIYRTMRKSLRALSRTFPFLFPRKKVVSEAEYISTLPANMRKAARREGIENLLSTFRCDEDIVRRFDATTAIRLWQMWNEVDPRYLELELICAANLPAMDDNGLTDAYAIAYLVPPKPIELLYPNLQREESFSFQRKTEFEQSHEHALISIAKALPLIGPIVDTMHTYINGKPASEPPKPKSVLQRPTAPLADVNEVGSGASTPASVQSITPAATPALMPTDPMQAQHEAALKSSLSSALSSTSNARRPSTEPLPPAIPLVVPSTPSTSDISAQASGSKPSRTPKQWLQSKFTKPAKGVAAASSGVAPAADLPTATVASLSTAEPSAAHPAEELPSTKASPRPLPLSTSRVGALASTPQQLMKGSTASKLVEGSPASKLLEGSPASKLSAGAKKWGKVRTKTAAMRSTNSWIKELYSSASILRTIRRLDFRTAFERLVTLLREMIFGRSFSSLAKMLSGGPVGAQGQYGGTYSRTRPKTLNPTWNQRLELRLAGGELNVATGEYDNADAPYTSLRIELWDRDLLTSDDFIGEVMIPLCPCMDKRQHTYTLPLTDPEGKTGAEGGVLPQGCTVTFKVAYES